MRVPRTTENSTKLTNHSRATKLVIGSDLRSVLWFHRGVSDLFLGMRYNLEPS